MSRQYYIHPTLHEIAERLEKQKVSFRPGDPSPVSFQTSQVREALELPVLAYKSVILQATAILPSEFLDLLQWSVQEYETRYWMSPVNIGTSILAISTSDTSVISGTDFYLRAKKVSAFRGWKNIEWWDYIGGILIDREPRPVVKHGRVVCSSGGMELMI